MRDVQMDSYDAIVVGGSVAGAPTAMLLARRGYKVLLVDKQRFPRDTNSTHFIWPRGVSYLARWGLSEHFRDKVPHGREMEFNIEGISLNGSVPITDLVERFEVLHGSAQSVTDQYMGPRRYFLDSTLIEQAEKSGAHVLQGCTFEHVIEEGGVVSGIECRKSNGEKYLARARIVIGADGRYSTFAEQVDAKQIDYRPLSTFAYYGYYSGICQTQLSIHKKGRLGTAIFPTLNDTQMVLVYGPTAWWDEFRKNAEYNFLLTYEYCAPEIADRIRAGRREEPFKACGTMSAFKRKNFGRGWALVGDAGSFKDQVTAMGITHAFRDAELATECISCGLSGEMELQEALGVYAARRSEDYDAYFDLVCETAEMNPYPKEEVWQLYAMRNDRASVDAMISAFGDTLPLAKYRREVKELEIADVPPWLRRYNPRRGQYDENVYVRSNRDCGAAGEAPVAS